MASIIWQALLLCCVWCPSRHLLCLSTLPHRCATHGVPCRCKGRQTTSTWGTRALCSARCAWLLTPGRWEPASVLWRRLGPGEPGACPAVAWGRMVAWQRLLWQAGWHLWCSTWPTSKGQLQHTCKHLISCVCVHRGYPGRPQPETAHLPVFQVPAGDILEGLCARPEQLVQAVLCVTLGCSW